MIDDRIRFDVVGDKEFPKRSCFLRWPRISGNVVKFERSEQAIIYTCGRSDPSLALMTL